MNETSTARLKLALSVLGLGFPVFVAKPMNNLGFRFQNAVHFGVPFGVLLGVRFGVHFGVHFAAILAPDGLKGPRGRLDHEAFKSYVFFRSKCQG